MQALHGQIGESVNLGVRHDDEIIYVERTSSGRSSVRVVHLVGARAPLHATAVGKLFLVEDGLQKLREYARRSGLPGFTPTSLTTLPALEKELDRVRRHGVAFDNEEIEQGLRCIAAPVRDDSGELSPSSPSRRPPSATTPSGSCSSNRRPTASPTRWLRQNSRHRRPVALVEMV
jgi:DNA-binding IclR family transcriptional regulator